MIVSWIALAHQTVGLDVCQSRLAGVPALVQNLAVHACNFRV